MITFNQASNFGIAHLQKGDVDTIYLRSDRYDPTALSDYLLNVPANTKLEEADEETFKRILEKIYSKLSSSALSSEVLEFESNISIDDAKKSLTQNSAIDLHQDDAPVIKLLNSVFVQSIQNNASDIHFISNESTFDIQLRIDGSLVPLLQLRIEQAPRIITRIKTISKINIAERRLPQDGRISVKLDNEIIDVRVSTLPTGKGERVVLRLLNKNSNLIAMSNLNMPQTLFDNFYKNIHQPNGLVLVTGPTGSGKTTTLYSAVHELKKASVNIMTVEDPVEVQIEGISQTQVNPNIKLDFAQGLRAILRQDPDVIMIGEIRDSETAQIALRASLTGHLVLSTLHTNNAVEAVNRLKDLGIDNYLISSSLRAILAQRLLRKYCEHCKHESLQQGAKTRETLFKLTGCQECNFTGLKGRIAIFELLVIDQRLQNKLLQGDLSGVENSKKLALEAKKYVDSELVPRFELSKTNLN